VMYNVAASPDASGFLYVVRGHPKNWAAVHRARRNYLCFRA
jgi:hypothetical protein